MDIDRFTLSPDASTITDKQTGASWDTKEAMRIMFSPEPKGGVTMDHTTTRRPNGRPTHPMLARDQLFEEKEATYNQGDQAPISGSDCLQFVRMCMQRLAGPDRDEFLEGLAELLSTETGAQDGVLQLTHGNGNGNGNGNGSRNNVPPNGNGNGNGVPKNNLGALDRTRGARDSRRPAQDSAVRVLNSQSFQRRFPYVNVSLSGTGR
jgi:hypothetical protein